MIKFDNIYAALTRKIKKWMRKWKIELISKFNPEWKDLYDEITGCEKRMESKTEKKFQKFAGEPYNG